MSDLLKDKIAIDEDFVDRCENLHSDAATRLKAGGGLTIHEAEGLSRVAYNLHRDIQRAIADAELVAKMARPKIGKTFSAWRFNYGDDPIGTVIADDGIKVTIEVPERVIPARTEQIVPGFTYQAERDEEHERWIDWSDKDETDESDTQ